MPKNPLIDTNHIPRHLYQDEPNAYFLYKGKKFQATDFTTVTSEELLKDGWKFKLRVDLFTIIVKIVGRNRIIVGTYYG